jgi:hypothetical protein
MSYLCISNRFWKSILMVVFGFLFYQAAYSQDVVVKGTVINEQNQRVVGAEVRLGQQNAKTNSKGTFLFKINEFPAQLTIRHSLYKEYLEVIRAPMYRRDTLFLDIMMENKETELEEVTISASRVIWAYQKPNTHIIDFVLIDKEILLICKEEHKYFLRRLDSIGEKIMDLQVKKSALNFYEDCTGGLHLVYADSIFELKLLGKSIGMLAGHTYLESMNILSPCVISSEDNFIVKRLGPHNKLVEYTKVDRNTKKPSLLYTTKDQKKMRELDDFASENQIAVPLSNPNFIYGKRFSTLTDRQRWDNEQFYNQILSKPLYAPIFEINDSIYIFDHFKDSALVYTISGNYVRSFQISYHYFENWKSELFLNKEKTKLYAKYEIDGLVTLRQINPSTGKVINLNVLEKHIHPLHIQIRNNYAYYIYKHYLDNSIHYLYKQPLKE